MTPQAHKGFIGLFASHPVAANLLMLLMIFSGIWALSSMNTQFFPKYDLNFINVFTVRTGANAEDIEQSITIPLEQELRNVDHIKKMTSSSRLGASSILIEFNEDTDMGLALNQVKEKVGLVRNLPEDAEEPEVVKIEDYEPVARVLVTGTDNLNELRPLVRQFERELLERGIAKVEFDGLPQEEIAIQVNSQTLKELGLSLNQIASKISSISRDVPAGTIGKFESAKQLRTLQQARTIRDFEELTLLADRDGRLIKLGDVATITRRPLETETRVFFKGQSAIDMSLLRVGDSDSLEAAAIIDNWLTETQPKLPPNIKLTLYEQNWQLIVERINLLLKNGLGGLILIVGILFFFLNTRVAFWVAVGIPVSFMATLAVTQLFGSSINMISLFALIMALGIIVDDAIVVAEDAMTHFQRGENALKAAEGGALRMLPPVMSSSLTTISAFLPLMLVSGIIGAILFTIPLVVVCVIIASLIESFLVLPGHLYHSFKSHSRDEISDFRKRLDAGIVNFRETKFRPVVTWAIHNRWSTIAASVGFLLVALSLAISGRINFNFFPSPEGTLTFANVQFVSGTPPSDVSNFLRHLETSLAQTEEELSPESKLVNIAVTRQNKTFSQDPGGTNTGENVGSLYVELISPDKRDINNEDFIQAWKQRINIPAGVENFSIAEAIAGPPGKDLDIKISHARTTQDLKLAALEMANIVKQYSGVSNIQDDLPYGQEQLVFSLTPVGETLGFTAVEVGQQIQAAFSSQLIQIFNEAEDEVEVRIMLPDNERYTFSTLSNLTLITPNGESVPLPSVVDFSTQRGIDVLRHTDGLLTVHVTANIDTRINNANKIINTLQTEVLSDFTRKFGVKVAFEGKAEEQRDTLGDLARGLVFAVSLIYIILAWVFASYSWPIAVMAVIPFGIAGALFGHFFMGLDLTLLSIFGLFGLSGIVINDSIVLITFYRQLRLAGMKATEAIIEASCQRFRAVILTSLTTIAGLTPLLFETSLQAQFLIPMATSISFGLAFGTLLVLLVVPALLTIVEDTVLLFTKETKNAPEAQV